MSFRISHLAYALSSLAMGAALILAGPVGALATDLIGYAASSEILEQHHPQCSFGVVVSRTLF